MDVPAGQPNGTAKTALLQLLVGLLRPTSGTVGLFGGTPARAWQTKRVASGKDDPRHPQVVGQQSHERACLLGSRLGLARSRRHNTARPSAATRGLPETTVRAAKMTLQWIGCRLISSQGKDEVCASVPVIAVLGGLEEQRGIRP
jgi:energy-coupling factor transporter ATP-binding protein EcfA2